VLSLLLDTVRLQVAHNEGAFLSLGASSPKSWRLAALHFGVAAVLLALLAYVLFAPALRVQDVLAPALILAGGACNLIHRFGSFMVVTL
jgi:signal peptidase II